MSTHARQLRWSHPSALSSDAASSAAPLTEAAALLGSGHSALPPASVESFSAAHESLLLREPWHSAGSPESTCRPCVFGRQCIGMRSLIPGQSASGPLVLAEAMTPADLALFEQSGANPAVRRPCVLCTRANVLQAYLAARQAVAQGAEDRPCVVFNWCSNPPDDYAPPCCVPFAEDGDAWLGIVGTVAMFMPDRLAMVQCPRTRLWRVDQSAMLRTHKPSRDTEDGALSQFLTVRKARIVFARHRALLNDTHPRAGHLGR